MGFDGSPVLLATDLDGTFLGGTDAQRAALYAALQRRRDRWILAFVTGRHLELVRSLYEEPDFPHPDYIIGDVGTTVVDARTEEPVAAVQDWIADRWNRANDRVKALLADEPGLELQPREFDYRVSYYYDPERFQPATLDKIAAAGFDAITSADRFLDVMPRGVSKGPTLGKLVEVLGIPSDRVVAAGDTLNDWSMLAAGYRAIAVGNAEPKLLEKLRDRPEAYCSAEPGAAGIAEGLRHFGFDPHAD